ncbi:TPA: LPXTG cell wall anchor domain-containing protein, partial [Enterococcus faecalis]|nr:LPXTG cell wall anchor domain-containing protein [Enterococcus faecalis]
QTVTYVYEKNDTKKGADEGNITHTKTSFNNTMNKKNSKYLPKAGVKSSNIYIWSGLILLTIIGLFCGVKKVLKSW